MLGFTASGVGIGVLLVAIALAELRSRTLPAWCAVALLVLGAAFLTPLARLLLAPAVVLPAATSLAMALPRATRSRR